MIGFETWFVTAELVVSAIAVYGIVVAERETWRAAT